MVEPIRNPVDAMLARGQLRTAVLERFQQINAELAKFIAIDIMEIDDERLRREVLLRTISQLSHQSNIVVNLAILTGIGQGAVEKATEIGQKTSAATLASAQAAGEKQIAEGKPDG